MLASQVNIAAERTKRTCAGRELYRSVLHTVRVFLHVMYSMHCLKMYEHCCALDEMTCQ